MVLPLILWSIAMFCAGAAAGMRYRRRELERLMAEMKRISNEAYGLADQARQLAAEARTAVTVSAGRATFHSE